MDKDKQSKPAPDAPHLALRCARASLLLASLRRSRAQPLPDRRTLSFSSAAAVGTCAFRSNGLLRGEVAAARREAAEHARIAGSELLLVLAVALVVLLLLLLLLLFIFGLLAEAP